MTTGTAPVVLFEPRLRRRRLWGSLFQQLCVLASLASVAVLIVLLAHIAWQGREFVGWRFVNSPPSQLAPESAGIQAPLWGTLWLMALTALFAVPTGVAAAIYLEEYARPNRLTRFIHLNIANLAGVPSIVYGLLGLAIFVRWLLGSRSLLAGALTLSLLVLPVIIIASREALLAVPRTIREAAYAVGATRWQCVRHHVLPAALPGIMTGLILSLSRAIGETAPLIMLGALTLVRTPPGRWKADDRLDLAGIWEWLTRTLDSQFTALPIQIFNWASQPDEIFRRLAAAGILVLLVVLLSMNALATGIRAWQQQRQRT